MIIPWRCGSTNCLSVGIFCLFCCSKEATFSEGSTDVIPITWSWLNNCTLLLLLVPLILTLWSLCAFGFRPFLSLEQRIHRANWWDMVPIFSFTMWREERESLKMLLGWCAYIVGMWRKGLEFKSNKKEHFVVNLDIAKNVWCLQTDGFLGWVWDLCLALIDTFKEDKTSN